jgi:glycosyltransferase involved in cell wall biosynthesis
MSASAKPISVALPMLTLFPGAMGGGETYARELSAGLARLDDFDVTVYLPGNAADWNPGPAREVEPRVHSGTGQRARLAGLWSAYRNSGRLRARMAGTEVVHFPFTVPIPSPKKGTRFAETAFDMQHRDLPELFGRGERLFRSFAYERPIRRADAVFTISEFSKSRIVHHLGVDESKIHVAYLGVDVDRFVPNHGERDDYLFYPARAWRHKNHAVLFDAFARLRRDRPELRLVLTGNDIPSLGELPPGVEWAGHVSLDELVRLYQRAAALVFPSRYEGFGLPVVEAMAAGCPVASSNAGSLPEICGDAAVLFDPDDPAAIAAGVEEALARSGELSRLGPPRAARFTWDSCVRVHADVYRELAAR